MGISKTPIVGSALIVAVLIIASIGVGYAYIAYTENSGNGMDVGQKSIMIYDSAGTSLECMELPAVTYSGSNNSWNVGYYDSHISGKLIASTPGTEACKIRVWVEMQDIRSWLLIEKLTVRLEGVDYVLFNSKSSDTSATEQVNAQIIKISNSDKGQMLDLAVMVTYKEHLDFNPNNINNLGKSKVMFALHTKDPISSGYSVTFKINKDPVNTRTGNNGTYHKNDYDNYLKYREDPETGLKHTELEGYIFPGDLVKAPATPTWKWGNSENYRFVGWYEDPECTNPWIFSSERLEVSDFDITYHNKNLFSKWQAAVYLNLNDDTGNKNTVWADFGGKIEEPTDPDREGYTFAGWFTLSEGGDQWNFATGTVSNSMNLYAHWTQN